MTIRIAFDIGGVLSKYPDILRPLLRTLVDGGASVFVLTDMHPHALVMATLKINGFDFIEEAAVIVADYTKHGEGCKAELLKSLAIDIFLDDFIGYVADPSCPIRCLVMPDSSRPYYATTWKTVDGEADFGRRTYKPEPLRPRCSCTSEPGDSVCELHPTCSNCGKAGPDPCEACAARGTVLA